MHSRRLRWFLVATTVWVVLGAVPPDAFDGTWALDAEGSTSIDPWNRLTLRIDAGPDRVRLARIWSAGRGIRAVDSMTIPIDGARHRVPLSQWPDNRHLGVSLTSDSATYVSARWLDEGRTLQTSTRLRLRTSQGTRRVRTVREYRLGPDGDVLTVLELRSTRPRPIRYTFRRAGVR